MSSEFAIKVENLSKCYHIYDTPHDRLKQFMLPRAQRLLGVQPKSYHREFWALRNVSFEIKKGETVGIIGRNGSGKSTLLQMICGTLNPTGGSVQSYGRIAALLELGSGFNPEFTGRENVYMNASVLGLSSEEIDAQFEEIAAFADIGDFIEQPVRTYSSGMMVRLAFAVQACVEPEILVVDEALAVGDIGFQYKCFKRMESLREKGVTILMVTHSSGSVLEYADRCIVLDNGQILEDTNDVLAAVLAYEKGMLDTRANEMSLAPPSINTKRIFSLDELRNLQASSRNNELNEKRFGSARAIIESILILKASGAAEAQTVFKSGEEIIFRFRILAVETITNVVLGVSLSKTQGNDIWGDNNLFAGQPIALTLGENVVEYCVRLPVSAGEYLVHSGLACLLNGGVREELDQRRPVARISFLTTREQVGAVYAPVRVFVSKNVAPPADDHPLIDSVVIPK